MTAIYCRQSVDKKDSISIETQEQECRARLRSGETDVQVYCDRGYSGKDTNRPDFQRLMTDVESGRVSKIIVYKLDRMSRSVLDFELTYRELKRHHVDFVSATEDFDTTSITGEAVLRVILIFAQLERETIQKRVTDNFYSRAERGFFMAGVAPLGYSKVADHIDGRKTSRLEEDSATSHIIRYIYRRYLSGRTIGEIVAELNSPECGINPGIQFHNVRVSRILANPVYVRADASVYSYFRSRGAVLHNDVSEFTGVCGCTVYGRRQGKTRSKFRDLSGENIQLNRHEGLISAEDWLQVQSRLSENHALKNGGGGTHSWLSGMIRCGYCGYALSVVTGQRNGKRYVSCGGRKRHVCRENKRGVTFEMIEDSVAESMLAYARKLQYHSAERGAAEISRVNTLKARRIRLEDEINGIVERFAQAENPLLRAKLNERMGLLERQTAELDSALVECSGNSRQPADTGSIIRLLDSWDVLDMDDRKAIARLMISQVTVRDSMTPIEVRFRI